MSRYYRKKSYGRRRSTNVVKMKFQSFMDISTSASSMQVITISAGGLEILRRLQPQFSAYKYFRIGRVSAKLVPASTLPVDPTGLSYEAGEQTVDPRDQLTPGMMRITNGEDIFEDLTGLSDAEQHGIYNNMLLDPRWFKWMLQSGTSRRAFPRYWQVGQLHQDKWPGAIVNIPAITHTDEGDYVTGTKMEVQSYVNDGADQVAHITGSSGHGFFQTGHKGVLGWLPTDCLQPVFNGSSKVGQFPLLASPPEIEVMKIILPKAYKTVYYYRLFITEEVWFREPIVNFGLVAGDGLMYRPLDVFHTPSVGGPRSPAEGQVDGLGAGGDGIITGGNYGNN